MVITNRLADFSIPLEGLSLIESFEGSFHIRTEIQDSYNLAYIAGSIWLGLAILRGVTVKEKVYLEKSNSPSL
jgi:hypothetical protein